MKCIEFLDHKTGVRGHPIRVSDQDAFDKVEKGWTRQGSFDYCPKHVWKSLTRDAGEVAA